MQILLDCGEWHINNYKIIGDYINGYKVYDEEYDGDYVYENDDFESCLTWCYNS